MEDKSEQDRPAPGRDTRRIEVLIGEVGHSHVARHVEARLDHRQSVALQRLYKR